MFWRIPASVDIPSRTIAAELSRIVAILISVLFPDSAAPEIAKCGRQASAPVTTLENVQPRKISGDDGRAQLPSRINSSASSASHGLPCDTVLGRGCE